jgi:hypothetical protein
MLTKNGSRAASVFDIHSYSFGSRHINSKTGQGAFVQISEERISPVNGLTALSQVSDAKPGREEVFRVDDH